jgi:hypothetical protein
MEINLASVVSAIDTDDQFAAGISGRAPVRNRRIVERKPATNHRGKNLLKNLVALFLYPSSLCTYNGCIFPIPPDILEK